MMSFEWDYQAPTWYETADVKEQEHFRKWLRGVLKTEKVELTFKKKDGTIRVMNCTLLESELPETEKNKEAQKENEASMPVFDLDKKEWRAFRFDSVKQINFTLGK